jgi:DNA polymerase alpha subunit A
MEQRYVASLHWSSFAVVYLLLQGMIASTTWSLTEMVASQLKVQREEIDAEDTSLYFDCETSTGQRLQKFVQHCELDAFFQMSIASKVQILPLTRQLTNLAGNSW